MSITKDKNNKAVTMTEIARLAGVSQSTVSRILNGSATVAPEKHAAVMEVIERLNFRPNVIAQGLVMGQTLTVGILTRYLGSPYFGNVLRGIERGVKEKGYFPIVVAGTETPQDDYQAINMLLSRRVDGLVLQVHDETPADYLYSVAANTPTIIIGLSVPGLEDHCVTVKNYEGAYAATSYLIQKGHRLIAHVAGPMFRADALHRYQGYQQALADAGLECYPELVQEGDFSEASGMVMMGELLNIRHELPFTAVFASNDQLALGVRLALYRRNIAVPDQISLLGFDDIPEIQYMIPPLTTVRQPLFQLGFAGTQSLFALMEGKQIHPVSFPLELVERETVRAAPRVVVAS
jgi:LacI family transcriptional regulator